MKILFIFQLILFSLISLPSLSGGKEKNGPVKDYFENGTLYILSSHLNKNYLLEGYCFVWY